VFNCSLRSLRCSLGCRRLRRSWRNGKALFHHLLLQNGGANIAVFDCSLRSQTKDVSAHSLVQDSGTPAWPRSAARDF
jgi:hypothetical protein